jgi:hypothetical protein
VLALQPLLGLVDLLPAPRGLALPALAVPLSLLELLPLPTARATTANPWAWGSNSLGQIGDGTSGTNRLLSYPPTAFATS